MKNFMEHNGKRVAFGIICIFLFMIFVVLSPYIINKLYNMNPLCDFFDIDYNVENILDYYGNVLAFIGTVSLGVITIYQNYLAQKKTDEVNKLQLELAKKSMALSEQNYQKQMEDNNNKALPKFEIKDKSINGHYMNLCVSLKNVSSTIVSRLISVSFEVYSSENEVLLNSDTVIIKTTSLLSGEETNIEFKNKAMDSNTTEIIAGYIRKEAWKNVNIVWKFQCDDESSKTHYFKAMTNIQDCNKFESTIWNVEKVG
ncbi:hypothetical protein ACQR2L_13760 [Clostridium butyricum]|uniref:hypothetical protein n=1 Tax=Clostridium butyricum TaxID=1492 RepID=UPI003D0CFCDC